MSSTKAPEKPAGPILSRVPPDEQFWRRYSPHGEAPLSIAGSIALHTLGLGGALLLIIYIASVLSKSTQSLPVEPVRLVLGGGGGSKGGVGDAPGVGKAPEDLGPQDPDPQAGVDDAPRQPALDKIELAEVEKKFDPVDFQYFKQTTSESAKALARFDEKLRRKLADGLAPGKGKGGTGSGGGDGTGKGPGEGSGAGAGKQAKLNQRERRMLRWHMRFDARSGPEYLAQLRGLGAILAFPVTEGVDPTYKVVHDLIPGRAKLETEDLSKIHRIYWIDDKPQSVQDILDALKLRLPRTPSRFVAFMPPKLETDLFDQEKRYVENILHQELRPGWEDKIEETVFRAVRAGKGYKAELISVAVKP
jgi:hypothetical protein